MRDAVPYPSMFSGPRDVGACHVKMQYQVVRTVHVVLDRNIVKYKVEQFYYSKHAVHEYSQMCGTENDLFISYARKFAVYVDMRSQHFRCNLFEAQVLVHHWRSGLILFIAGTGDDSLRLSPAFCLHNF